MYNTIINPINNKKTSLFSKKGKKILKNYVKSFYGAGNYDELMDIRSDPDLYKQMKVKKQSKPLYSNKKSLLISNLKKKYEGPKDEYKPPPVMNKVPASYFSSPQTTPLNDYQQNVLNTINKQRLNFMNEDLNKTQSLEDKLNKVNKYLENTQTPQEKSSIEAIKTKLEEDIQEDLKNCVEQSKFNYKSIDREDFDLSKFLKKTIGLNKKHRRNFIKCIAEKYMVENNKQNFNWMNFKSYLINKFSLDLNNDEKLKKIIQTDLEHIDMR